MWNAVWIIIWTWIGLGQLGNILLWLKWPTLLENNFGTLVGMGALFGPIHMHSIIEIYY